MKKWLLISLLLPCLLTTAEAKPVKPTPEAEQARKQEKAKETIAEVIQAHGYVCPFAGIVDHSR